MQSRFAEGDDHQDFDYRRLPSFSEDRHDRREESPEPSAQPEEEGEGRWPWSLGRRTASQGRANSRGAQQECSCRGGKPWVHVQTLWLPSNSCHQDTCGHSAKHRVLDTQCLISPYAGVPGVVVVGSDGEDLDDNHHQPPSPTGSTYSKRSTVPDNHSRKTGGGKGPGRESRAR